MKTFVIVTCAILIPFSVARADGDDSNIHQQFSVKFGYYQPHKELNNGLLLGVDGITEFIHYNFFLSGSIDLYPKQSIDIFGDPKPDITQQSIYLIPIHINIGYKVFDIHDADTRGYVGIGGGYYLYFYNITYNSSNGGVLGGTSLTSVSDSRNGGSGFATLFARILIGKVFVEPCLYIAGISRDAIGGYSYSLDPSGFAVTFGFQY